MPVNQAQIDATKAKLDRLKRSTKVLANEVRDEFEAIVQEIKLDIDNFLSSKITRAQMKEIVEHAISVSDEIRGVGPTTDTTGRDRGIRRRMSTSTDKSLGDATTPAHNMFVAAPHTPLDEDGILPGATLDYMKDKLFDLLTARVNCSTMQADASAKRRHSVESIPEVEVEEDDLDDDQKGKTVVKIVSNGIDANILNRRGDKVFAKNPLKRLSDKKTPGYENDSIDINRTLKGLVDVKFHNLSLPNQERVSKSEDESEYKGDVRAQNFADTASMYHGRILWSLNGDNQLVVEANNGAGVFQNVATLTLTEDSATLILDSDSVRPAISDTQATNRQAAGRSLQELVLQTSALIGKYSEITPRFMHVYTPDRRGDPIRDPSKVDVEALVNTSMTVVLDSQNIPMFDPQTLQAFESYKTRTDESDDLRNKILWIEHITDLATSGTSKDKLNALAAYNDYRSHGRDPDDPYVGKAKKGIDNARSKL